MTFDFINNLARRVWLLLLFFFIFFNLYTKKIPFTFINRVGIISPMFDMNITRIIYIQKKERERERKKERNE